MTKFKVGDKVRRIAGSNMGGIEIGGVYTVESASRDWLQLKEIKIKGNSHPYDDRYFEMAESIAISDDHKIPAHKSVNKLPAIDYKAAFRDACALMSHDTGAIKRLMLKYPDAFKE